MNKPSGISIARSSRQEGASGEIAEKPSVVIDFLEYSFARYGALIAENRLDAFLEETAATTADIEAGVAVEYVAGLMGLGVVEVAAAPLTALVLTGIAGYASWKAAVALLNLTSNLASPETSQSVHQVTNALTLQGAAAAGATYAITGDTERALKNAELANLIQKAGKFVVRGGFPRELIEKMATSVDIWEVGEYEWNQARARTPKYAPAQSPQYPSSPEDEGGYYPDQDNVFDGSNGPSCDSPSDNSGGMCSSF